MTTLRLPALIVGSRKAPGRSRLVGGAQLPETEPARRPALQPLPWAYGLSGSTTVVRSDAPVPGPRYLQTPADASA